MKSYWWMVRSKRGHSSFVTNLCYYGSASRRRSVSFALKRVFIFSNTIRMASQSRTNPICLRPINIMMLRSIQFYRCIPRESPLDLIFLKETHQLWKHSSIHSYLKLLFQSHNNTTPLVSRKDDVYLANLITSSNWTWSPNPIVNSFLQQPNECPSN